MLFRLPATLIPLPRIQCTVTVQGASSASLLSVLSCHFLQLVTWAISADSSVLVCADHELIALTCRLFPSSLIFSAVSAPCCQYILCYCSCMVVPVLCIFISLYLVFHLLPLLCSGRLDEESFSWPCAHYPQSRSTSRLGIAPDVVSTACVRRFLCGRLWGCYTSFLFMCVSLHTLDVYWIFCCA